MANSYTATGLITASKIGTVIYPSISPSYYPPVVYMHAYGSNGRECLSNPNSIRIVSKICDTGFGIVANTQEPAAFGQDVGSQDRIADDLTYAHNTMGASDEPCVILGWSMGSIGALRFAALNPELVACVVIFDPVPCLDYAYQEDIGSHQAEIGTAYGVTFPDPLPSNADPAGDLLAPILAANISIQSWHSNEDTYTDSSSPYQAWVDRVGVESHDTGAGGHSSSLPIVADDYISNVLTFILNNTR